MMFCDAIEFTKLTLVQDLAAVMLAAGLVAALFHVLGWPKVIGYIAAGALMGLPGIKSFLIANESSVNNLANLGVIFLMFTMGLELNIRKLRRIGGVIFPTALIDLAMMLLLGYTVGRYVFGWGMLPSIFLGAVVCDSSTTLLAKSLEEMGCSRENFAGIIFGTTISEDVITIGVMAILTGLALTGQFQAKELAVQLGYLILFLVGVMVFGLRLLPGFVNRLRKMKDDETLLIIVLGICFGIAFVAEKMSFSLALGAFLVGAVVAESSVSKRVHEHTSGLRSMFSAVFFVTIGLMVDLKMMWHNWPYILAVTLLVLIGKTLNCMIGSFMMGQEYKDALKTGVGLAQIGDFAYMVALLGMTLNEGAEPYPQMYQIAVGVSVITTLVNPFLLKQSQPLSIWLERKLPKKITLMLENYTLWVKKAASSATKNNSQFRRKAVFFALDLILVAVVFAVAHYFSAQNRLWSQMPKWIASHKNMMLWLVSCVITFPMFISSFLHSKAISQEMADAYIPSFVTQAWSQSLRRMTQIIVLFLCMFILLLEFTFLSALLFFDLWVFVTIIAVFSIVAILNWKKFHEMAIEGQDTLTKVLGREDDGENETDETMTIEGDPVRSLTVPEKSGAAGHSLASIRFRNSTGATISKIIHANGDTILSPGPDDVVQIGDVLMLLANDEQYKKAVNFFKQKNIRIEEGSAFTQVLGMHLEKIIIPESSSAIGKSLMELRLRNIAGTTVVRIIRADNTAVDNPGPNAEIAPNDEVFLFGDTEQIEKATQLLTM